MKLLPSLFSVGLAALLLSSPVRADPDASAHHPAPRADANSLRAHDQLLAKARHGRIDLYFVGDSITRRWGATDYPYFLTHLYADASDSSNPYPDAYSNCQCGHCGHPDFYPMQ